PNLVNRGEDARAVTRGNRAAAGDGDESPDRSRTAQGSTVGDEDGTGGPAVVSIDEQGPAVHPDFSRAGVGAGQDEFACFDGRCSRVAVVAREQQPASP